MSSPNDDQKKKQQESAGRGTPSPDSRRAQSDQIGAGSSSASGSGAGGDRSPPPPPPPDNPKGVGGSDGASERLEKSRDVEKELVTETVGEVATAEGSSKAGKSRQMIKRKNLDKEPASAKAGSSSGAAAEAAAAGQLPVEGASDDATNLLRSCSECGKKFANWKGLFGHLRSHPNRPWRGAYPPPVSPPPPKVVEQAEELAFSLLEIGKNIMKNMKGEGKDIAPTTAVGSSLSLDLNQLDPNQPELPTTEAERRRKIHAELDLNKRAPEMDEEEEEEEEGGGSSDGAA